MVVAAHPDDEILGAGGVMARHAAAGDEVFILIMATGAASRAGKNAPAVDIAIPALKQAAHRAASVVGARPPLFAGLPDNRVDSLDLLDVVREVEDVFADIAPDVVYTHNPQDLNIDHEITARAVLTAVRPQPGQKVCALYAFEVPSATDWYPRGDGSGFAPNHFVDISGAPLAAKMKALACYEAEMRPFPHARSARALEALAHWRGAHVGLQAAEGFSVLREIVK
jgi:LmbE family N-acetylglucosaminyl deacetylase